MGRKSAGGPTNALHAGVLSGICAARGVWLLRDPAARFVRCVARGRRRRRGRRQGRRRRRRGGGQGRLAARRPGRRMDPLRGRSCRPARWPRASGPVCPAPDTGRAGDPRPTMDPGRQPASAVDRRRRRLCLDVPAAPLPRADPATCRLGILCGGWREGDDESGAGHLGRQEAQGGDGTHGREHPVDGRGGGSGAGRRRRIGRVQPLVRTQLRGLDLRLRRLAAPHPPHRRRRLCPETLGHSRAPPPPRLVQRPVRRRGDGDPEPHGAGA